MKKRQILIKKIDSDNVNIRIELLTKLTSGLFRITQNLFDKKVQIKYNEADLESKIIRFGYTNHTITNLLQGTNINLLGNYIKNIDLFSVYSIMRLQIESFIMIYYLVFDEISSEEKEYRYNIYKLHGLQKQYNVKVYTPEGIKLKEKINDDIQKIIASLKETVQYKEASKAEKEKILEPPFSKIIKPEILFNNSGISLFRIRDIWNIYSNHAHAEHISDRQYNYFAEDVNRKTSAIISVINQCSVLTTKLITLIAKHFENQGVQLIELEEEIQLQLSIWEQLEILAINNIKE